MSVNRTDIYVDENGSAVFPDGIEEIKNFALYDEKKLESAVIPDTVKRIGMYAFCGCENLEELILPQSLKFIGRRAFGKCRKLKHLVMPDSVSEIADNVFEDVEFNESVYNRDKSILYVYKNTCISDVIVLPDTVKRIFSGAFTGKIFADIILHEGIEQIDTDAFFNCILCKKLTVNCSVDKIEKGAFRNFRPKPEFCFAGGTPDYTDLLRICGEIPVKRAEKLEIPTLTPLKRHKLESIIADCSKEEPDTMIKVAEFFSRIGNTDFYQAAANFWYYRAMLYGSEKAAEFINEKCNKERSPLSSVAWPGIGDESGKRLYALGFSFFDKKRDYSVSWPDENGIVEVTAYAGSDGPDEDGFGREEYYDWWFLDENLRKIPYTTGLFGYSNHDKRNNEDKFRAQYELAVRYSKGIKEIKRRIEELFKKYVDEHVEQQGE